MLSFSLRSLLPLLVLSLALPLAACTSDSASSGDESDIVAGGLPPAPKEEEKKEEVTAPKLDDAALVAELKKTLEGQELISESEFPWTIIEGDGKDATKLDAKAIAEHLGKAIGALEATEGRDLAKLTHQDGSFDELFDALEDGGEDADAAYSKARALLKANLTDLVVVDFDVTEVGDQNTGPIIVVVAGKSASGKLIALVSFAVAT